MPIDMPPPVSAYDDVAPMTIIADNSAKYGWPRKWHTTDKQTVKSRVRLYEIPSDAKGTVRCRFAKSPSLSLWHNGPRVQCTVAYRTDAASPLRKILTSIGTIWEDGSFTYFTTGQGPITYNPSL